MSPTTRAKAHSTGDPTEAQDVAAGSKHELADKDEPKKEGTATKKQKTLEETMENGNDKSSKKEHVAKEDKDDESKVQEKTGDGQKKTTAGSNQSKSESDTTSDAKLASASNGHNKSASSILEKGIIYFFLRGRVNTEDPSSVNDIARTYFLLRPASSPDHKPTPLHNNHSRLIAVPKKTFPKTGRERWISFVEKTGVSFEDLRDSFLAGNDYVTKTRGTQHTPAAKPEGEGVYAITTTGRESHLCYILTRPEELGEVQKKLGLKDKGSFIISTRNPEYPPPGNARLPESPEFPEEIKKDFHTLRWAPTKPNHLDVEGAQILLVGESSGIEKATEPPKDQEKGEEDPREELEELAEEDEKRMEGLSQDDSEAIFADLHASAKDYPDMQKTF